MPSYVCVRCKQPIPADEVQRDASGQTVHAACGGLPATPIGPGTPVSTVPVTGLVIADVRIPFGTVFTVVSQVLGVIALWSLVGWIFVSCIHAVFP